MKAWALGLRFRLYLVLPDLEGVAEGSIMEVSGRAARLRCASKIAEKNNSRLRSNAG